MHYWVCCKNMVSVMQYAVHDYRQPLWIYQVSRSFFRTYATLDNNENLLIFGDIDKIIVISTFYKRKRNIFRCVSTENIFLCVSTNTYNCRCLGGLQI